MSILAAAGTHRWDQRETTTEKPCQTGCQAEGSSNCTLFNPTNSCMIKSAHACWKLFCQFIQLGFNQALSKWFFIYFSIIEIDPLIPYFFNRSAHCSCRTLLQMGTLMSTMARRVLSRSLRAIAVMLRLGVLTSQNHQYHQWRRLPSLKARYNPVPPSFPALLPLQRQQMRQLPVLLLKAGSPTRALQVGVIQANAWKNQFKLGNFGRATLKNPFYKWLQNCVPFA